MLGAVFLQLCQLLSLGEHPTIIKPVDPSLYISRFTESKDLMFIVYNYIAEFVFDKSLQEFVLPSLLCLFIHLAVFFELEFTAFFSYSFGCVL